MQFLPGLSENENECRTVCVSEKASNPKKSGTGSTAGVRAMKFITSSWVTAGFSGNTKGRASRTPASTHTESRYSTDEMDGSLTCQIAGLKKSLA